ncbi:MAG: glutathione S-transferase family protein [Alphaproteobacteria bacterium]|nr:glutathione S-transferase family protein [Alphaproteobacteria bacterium]
MADTTVYGYRRSVYVRIVRLALEEKAASYRLVEIDPFAPGGLPAAYLERHPFGRIPAFEHDGFRLYETGAITRYIDDVFPGPALRPGDAKGRARVDQIMSLLDNHAYRTMVWDVFVERARGGADETRIAAAMARADTCMRALEDHAGDGPWLVGSGLSLADLHAAPIFAYFRRTGDGAALIARHPRIAAWWAATDARPSMAATRFPVEETA